MQHMLSMHHGQQLSALSLLWCSCAWAVALLALVCSGWLDCFVPNEPVTGFPNGRCFPVQHANHLQNDCVSLPGSCVCSNVAWQLHVAAPLLCARQCCQPSGLLRLRWVRIPLGLCNRCQISLFWLQRRSLAASSHGPRSLPQT
jgi:hypothetical protein